MTPQPLHIFQKDLRHLWPETLVTLLLFVAFAWAVPYGWQTTEYSIFIKLLAGFLHVLMPIAWLIVISRLIHDESLVGDRQFWTSRPYHWASLLAAKALYIVVFLYVPFFLMQVYLLKHAGLYPTTAIPALLHNLLLLTVILIVPIAAIAAVTSTFPRLLLSTIGAIIYILIVAGLFGFAFFDHMPPPHLSGIIAALVIVLPLAALIYQYATRKTTTSRILLLATPILIPILLILTPATALIHSSYPVIAAADAPTLTVIPAPPGTPVSPGHLQTFRGNVLLNLPFAVKDSDKDSNYALQGVEAHLTGPTTWTSAYLSTFGSSINASVPYTVVRLFMPQSVFDKAKTSPADLHLSIAADHLKAKPTSTWKSTLLPFSIPGHGVCFSSSESPDEAPTCRFPLKAPEILYASAPLSATSCAQQGTQQVSGRAALSSSSSTLDFDPVITVPLNFTTGDPNPQHHYQFCAGTPLTFLEAESVGKVRFEVDAKQLTLDPYATRVQARATPGAPAPQPE